MVLELMASHIFQEQKQPRALLQSGLQQTAKLQSALVIARITQLCCRRCMVRKAHQHMESAKQRSMTTCLRTRRASCTYFRGAVVSVSCGGSALQDNASVAARRQDGLPAAPERLALKRLSAYSAQQDEAFVKSARSVILY